MPSPSSSSESVVVIGAGPAGLTAAYLLAEQGFAVTVLEADPVYVGGISKTVMYQGYRFDIGGHRFFSKSKAVEDFWSHILPHDMLDRPRSSRIFYRNKFFSYPLKAFEALFRLGIFESALCVLSYAKAKVFPVKNPANFEDWVSNHFGKRLFNIFFKTYTEKVWGMKCREISADWAAQRIKGLSLGSAIWNALIPARTPKDRSHVIKTLIDSFRYPRLGPGMMWEAVAEKLKQKGMAVQLGARVSGLHYDQARDGWEVTCEQMNSTTGAREQKKIAAKHVISSAPIRELAQAITPALQSRERAQQLRYRDFVTVAIIVKDRQLFDDNWIYIHDPSVKVGRIQNFKSWSPELIPEGVRETTNCYGLEYFCFEGDGLWASPDSELIELATKELSQLGLVDRKDVLDGCVVRQAKAYPVYDDAYAERVEEVRQEIQAHYPNLHLIGRNGMHKYNNQDHAMMTAMLTAENIIQGKAIYDVWQVNQDAEYHEAGTAATDSTSGLRLVPGKVKSNSQN